jgi:hypothetical protein
MSAPALGLPEEHRRELTRVVKVGLGDLNFMKCFGKLVSGNTSDQTKFDLEQTFVMDFCDPLTFVFTFVLGTVHALLLGIHGLVKNAHNLLSVLNAFHSHLSRNNVANCLSCLEEENCVLF